MTCATCKGKGRVWRYWFSGGLVFYVENPASSDFYETLCPACGGKGY